MRLFHLTDLPQELVFIYFEDTFRRKFLEVLKRAFGTYEKAGEFVNYTNTGIIESFRIKNRFTKLSTIIKLANYLSKSGYYEFNLNKIEKKIIAYRGIGTSLIIKNPNFPLKEDERIIRIFFHLLGDGYGGKYGMAKPFYRNYTKELLDEFEKDLRVFGEVPHIKRETIVEIPSVIGYILEHIYKINFETYKSFIPSAISKLPREFIAQGIKAFGDDEANVDDCRIRFYSFNNKLLVGISNLIKRFPEFTGKIGGIRRYKTYLRGKEYVGYSFPILSSGLKSYYNLIGFSHLEKAELLKRIVKRKERNWAKRSNNITKLLILQSLKRANKAVREISKDVGTTNNTIRSHFEGNRNGILSLRKIGFAKLVGLTKSRGKVWSITIEGLNFLEENKKKLDKFSVVGDNNRLYLMLVGKSQKKEGWVMPSRIAKKKNCRNDTVSKQLLKLYRANFLTRSRTSKEEYRYELNKTGITFLTANKE